MCVDIKHLGRADHMIEFKFHKPTAAPTSVLALAIVASIILMTFHIWAGIAGLLLSQAANFAFIAITARNKNLSGTFSFAGPGFSFACKGKTFEIAYHDIASVTREFYSEEKSILNIGYTQANPNQYVISLKNGRRHVLRVAGAEEKAYAKAIQALNKRIYGTGSLGVKLTSSLDSDPESLALKDTLFEQEKPEPGFSLVAAINALLQHCGLPLCDTTLPGLKRTAKKTF